MAVSCGALYALKQYTLTLRSPYVVDVYNKDDDRAYVVHWEPDRGLLCDCPDAIFRGNTDCKHIRMVMERRKALGFDPALAEYKKHGVKPPERPRNPDFCPGSEVADHRHGWVLVNDLREARKFWLCTFCGDGVDVEV